MDKKVIQQCRRLYGDLIFQLGHLSGPRRIALARAASAILPSISYSAAGSILISHRFVISQADIEICCDYDYWYDRLTEYDVQPVSSELQAVLASISKYKECLKIDTLPYTHRICMELVINHLGEM